MTQDITMTKEQGKDSIEHLWRLLKETVPAMISKAGGVQKIGAHKITDAVMRRLRVSISSRLTRSTTL
jgi:hypothetical protein